MPASGGAVATDEEVGSLRVLGVEVQDLLAISEFKIAHILGKHFRAGEWGSYRCGSVITCVMNGRSLYARVNRFITVEDDDCEGYASVTWFGVPEYPFEIPLVVKCSEEQPDEDLFDELGCIIRITQIDPSQVMVERSVDHTHCFMMRDSGFDTVRDWFFKYYTILYVYLYVVQSYVFLSVRSSITSLLIYV